MQKKTLLIWLFCVPALVGSCANPASPATSPASAQSPGPSTRTAGSQSRITVWLDSARMDGAQIYQRLFPDKASLIDFQEVDRNQFPADVLRFNQQGQGWPDVVFAETNLVAQVVDSQHDYPIDLKPALSAQVLNNFEPHANDA